MNHTSTPIKGRFAPSPSGRMHLGNVLCALLSWVSAKAKGGEVVLRIEDLDRDRCPRKYADTLEEDLRWLGLTYDEGGSDGGPHASYYQSERDEIYEAYFEKLRDRIYPCFCSRAALHAASAPHLSDGRVIYAGTCRDLTPEEIAAAMKKRKPAARLRVPDRTVEYVDGVQGVYREHLPTECGDYIIRRSDGVFGYQLAVVVDDALEGVNEVVRGCDLISSAPRQIWLHEVLGFAPPAFFHMPLLCASDGRRLSKRDEDLDL
ncbi:MAG: tRNA glutamyl-Q(34) synthetase GluQRS, partial [Butyricicoccus sp.]|nr:tRNA glutamyl-Q(34) synthetase GluQRS [Butyricicoccus sp.]